MSLTAELRFVRYGTGVGLANIQLVFVYTENESNRVHWIYPEPDKEVGQSDWPTYSASTVELSKETLGGKTYHAAYKRDAARLREAVDSKRPDILHPSVCCNQPHPAKKTRLQEDASHMPHTCVPADGGDRVPAVQVH